MTSKEETSVMDINHSHIPINISEQGHPKKLQISSQESRSDALFLPGNDLPGHMNGRPTDRMNGSQYGFNHDLLLQGPLNTTVDPPSLSRDGFTV